MATVSNFATQAPTTTRSRVHVVTSMLHWTYALVPIIAGADKFFNFLTNWEKYLSSAALSITHIPAHTFMSIVGVIEIIAGVLVWIRPKLGSLIVALWLIGIVINLLMTGKYYDVAVRDLVMAIGAFSFNTLISAEHNGQQH
jgi:hypothetical protein